MDKFNRLTANAEWQVGARYRRAHHRENKLVRSVKVPVEATFLGWHHTGTREMVGQATLLYADGKKVVHGPESWRGRWELLAPSAPADLKPNALVGQFFHSLTKDTGKVHWQGVVMGNPAPGWYLLQLFEWIGGEPNVRRLACIEDMETWLFYPDTESMQFSYRSGVARPGGPYRDK